MRFWPTLRTGRRTCRRVYSSVGPTRPEMQVRGIIPRTYSDVDAGDVVGLLFLLYSCVSMIFWRVFMRISYSCPAHLKFGLTVEQWSALVKLTGDAIDWLDKHDKMYDVWLMVAYASTSCALVQVGVIRCGES